MISMKLCFFLAALAMTVIATPFTHTQPTVRHEDSKACVDGPPATLNYSGGLPMDYYTLIVPTEIWTSYSVKKAWFDAHYISGPITMGVNKDTDIHPDTTKRNDSYSAFKFQYNCNADRKCSSYFVWEDSLGDNCYLFDDVMTPDVFEPSNGTVVIGAYDRRCGM